MIFFPYPKKLFIPYKHFHPYIKKMKRTVPTLPAQLKNIIETEGKSKNLKICLENIERAKKNELNAYLSLCHARLNLPPSDSTSRPQG